MRLRSTAAAALLASFALVLPTAGQSLANEHDRDGLGELHYRYSDDGDVRRRTIEPADNDTCYRLTGTTPNRPAFWVDNDTESLALLYRGDSCGGEAVEALQPGERAHDLSVRSVYFKPSHHSGHHSGRDDWEDDEDRGDWGDEDRGARPGQGRGLAHDSFVNSILRNMG
ncbi:hypothetical protein [Streptomyces sp. NBC_00091]|uniref:hypothetical protein n=1 Tax=Streptomyces sp. NBC_00091 TaxID=2975648 RepID=UPI00225A2196|nr:hypothetical protein [Streptomyces sp. NBC_00091]MCX5375760.1 hypothetical protein [Streptomyces sp. NBC_00091]